MKRLTPRSPSTWGIAEQFHWLFLEINLGIACASASALQPLAERYLGPLFSSQLRSSERELKKQPKPYSIAGGQNAEGREVELQG
ncbi:hypothetical protein DL768_009665 [Monosporascus sp. mg162]|nr:hypothetical protein DL768_009665 [Monosporascus sp. mg162]